MTPRAMNTAALAMLRPCRFRFAFLGSQVRLAIEVHSLVRFSKRTTQHRLHLHLTVRSHVGHSVSGLVCSVVLSPTDFKLYCTVRLGVLFSVRSRYLFTIGLEECLVLSGDARCIHEGYPTPATLELTHEVLRKLTGLSPCFTLYSKRLQFPVRSMKVSPDTTLPRGASVWTVSRLLAVTNDIAVAFFSYRY